MFNRVWNLSSKNEFAVKLRKKTGGGAFFNFPRFAAAHCRHKNRVITEVILILD